MKNKIICLNDNNYEKYVLNKKGLFIVIFGAEWCGPCKMITPILEEIANEFYFQLKIGKLNIDKNNVTTLKYNIKSIPTFLFYCNGEVVYSKVGMLSKVQLKDLIIKYKL